MWADWKGKQKKFLKWRRSKSKLRDLKYWAFLVKQFFKMLPILSSEAVVLDVGSSGGKYMKGVVDRFDCFAICIDPYSSKSNFSPIKGVAEYLPFKEKCFDFVFTTASLDHFNSPKNFVSNLNSVLKENGYFMVVQGVETKNNESADDPTHLRSFSEHSLLTLFSSFHLIEKKTISCFCLVTSKLVRLFY